MAVEQFPDPSEVKGNLTFGRIYHYGLPVGTYPRWVAATSSATAPGEAVGDLDSALDMESDMTSNQRGLHLVSSELSESGVEAAREAVDIALNQVTPDNEQRESFVRRHQRALLLGGMALALMGAELAVSAATGVSVQDVINEVAREAKWAGPALAVTEAVTTAGFITAAIGVGMKVGNPITLPKRLAEVRDTAVNNPVYRWGMRISGAGALASAGVATAAMWMSGLPIGTKTLPSLLLAGDAAETVVSRKFLLPDRTDVRDAAQVKEKKHDVQIRLATEQDSDALVDLDLRLFRKAYGNNAPNREDVSNMFKARLANNPEGMFIAVVDGKIKGFATGFRTNKTVEQFESWERSTANGRLEGVVEPNGKYLYVANLTMDTHGTGPALDMLIASLFAKAIEDGVQYGYFCSRMPGFKRWVMNRATETARDINALIPSGDPLLTPEECLPQGEQLDKWAREYAGLRHPVDSAGKVTRPRDPELAFYGSVEGLTQLEPKPNAFDDDASMNYQVPFVGRVPLPGYNVLRHIAPARRLVASGLRVIARHPKLLAKVL